jgi:hypothetical protein
MAKPDPAPSDQQLDGAGRSYWTISRRPLQILAFLLPLILAYELGLALVLRSDAGVLTNKAHETLLRFFAAFGVTPTGSLYLGGVVIVVVLLLWHVLNRDRWRVYPKVAGLMACEALLLTLPLLVVARLMSRDPAAGQSAAATVPQLHELNLWSRMAISVGAGLYEELMFRMLLIAVVHTLLVDVGKVPHLPGAAIAVAVSAAAFMLYHPLQDASGRFVPASAIFFFLAGLYFGAVYAARGFGIVVGVHALYDIIIVCLPGP